MTQLFKKGTLWLVLGGALLGASAQSAATGTVTAGRSQVFVLADLVQARGELVASTKYQVALLFPVPIEHVAVPVSKQGVFKATVAGKIVYLDVARAGGRATLSVSLGDAGLAQFDVALTDREDGVTRYTVSQTAPTAAGTPPPIMVASAAPKPPRPVLAPQGASPLPKAPIPTVRAVSTTIPAGVSRPLWPTGGRETPAPVKAAPIASRPAPIPPQVKAPAQSAPQPARATSETPPPAPTRAAAGSAVQPTARLVNATRAPALPAVTGARGGALRQVLVTRGLTLDFTTRRDGAATLVVYRVTGQARARSEDLAVQDALGTRLGATVLGVSVKPGVLWGKLRVASTASLLRVRWAAKGQDGVVFPITKTLFVR